MLPWRGLLCLFSKEGLCCHGIPEIVWIMSSLKMLTWDFFMIFEILASNRYEKVVD